ncbi:hypothetical protein FNL37_0867 [Methylovorus glucosotrophus]|nr:hypothetical protein FNL37_0867 [Methylovorus glucosotrophus]
MRNIHIIPLVLLLTGCATSSPTYAPDGSKAFSLDCSGAARNWGMCYEKAGQLCKEKGYEIVAGGSDSNSTVVANQNGVYAGSTQTRSMVIKCKQ